MGVAAPISPHSPEVERLLLVIGIVPVTGFLLIFEVLVCQSPQILEAEGRPLLLNRGTLVVILSR